MAYNVNPLPKSLYNFVLNFNKIENDEIYIENIIKEPLEKIYEISK